MPTSRQLVDRVGGHASALLGLDLEGDEALFPWLVAACLLAAPRERALAAWRALAAADATGVAALAESDPARLGLLLEEAGLPRPERFALTLVRAARALAERHGGSLAALLREAGDLEAAGAALVSLAPGLGGGSALRFLRALRDRLPGAADAPPAASALSAAVCLGWIPPGADPEGVAASLARRLGEEPDAPSLRDVEAALERLGAASCARGRPARCPLAVACPLRYRQEP
jgi:hypothetical protein